MTKKKASAIILISEVVLVERGKTKLSISTSNSMPSRYRLTIEDSYGGRVISISEKLYKLLKKELA